MLARIFCLLLWITTPSASFAWSNYFKFINNLNIPLQLSTQPTLGKINSTCNTSSLIAAHAASCELEFTTEKPNWYSPPQNSGTISIALANDTHSVCIYHYDYTYKIIPYNYFDLHSENFTLQSCQGKLNANEFSVINDAVQALPRPMVANAILTIYQSTESFSQADCGGNSGDNCIIASPDLNTVYRQDGSTLNQALALQNKLAQFSPLNAEQFLGAHNAAISRHYTNSASPFNLSYSDPDNYLSLTEQLDSGIRQIELDIQWYNNRVTLCHNRVSPVLQLALCEGDFAFSTAIAEIKTWVENHPQELILLYLDANQPLTDHISDIDMELHQLEPYVFSPQDAEQFGVVNHALPASQVTQAQLIQQLHKNIIVTNDDDVENFKQSRYVFVSVQGTASTPLYENSVNTVMSLSACEDDNKYASTQKIFNEDVGHYNLWRVNSDRTGVSYADANANKNPEDYSNYFTLNNIPLLQHCPINIFSTNMLGYTCNDSQCVSHPTDPKLYAFLWSWELGFPLSHGSKLAYINPQHGHFENEMLVTQNYAVLCRKNAVQKMPVAVFPWYLEQLKVTDAELASQQAQQVCQRSGGVFSVPVTSYEMHDVLRMLGASGVTTQVLVNYENV